MTAKNRIASTIAAAALLFIGFPVLSQAWHDKTHIAIAKAAGYQAWYNAAGADIAKVKAGDKEALNHFSDNPPGTVITPKMILDHDLASKYQRVSDHSEKHEYQDITLCRAPWSRGGLIAYAYAPASKDRLSRRNPPSHRPRDRA
jgi:hypothetical protein